jgi:hypothetical protein
MPIKDASVVNLLFQLEFNTDLQLSDIFRFLKGRADEELDHYLDPLLLQSWAESWAEDEGLAKVEDMSNETLVNQLTSRLNSSEIIALMYDPDIVDVSEKSVEWLVETLMERDQGEVAQYLEMHGFVVEE